MPRITLTLTEQEKKALRRMAEKEFREPRLQAIYILRTELERRGLLRPEDIQKEQAAAQAAN